MTSQTLTILGYCLSVILGVGIPSFIYYRKKYFVGSFLTVEFQFSNGIGSPVGVIKPFIDEDGYGVRNKSIVRHHLTWRYKIIITNNSDQTAFFPKISYNAELFPDIQLEEIKELQPIGSKESKIIDVEFFEVSDTLPSQRKRTTDPPTDFTALKLLLEYYNGQDAKFYTLYNNADKSNRSYKLRPKF